MVFRGSIPTPCCRAAAALLLVACCFWALPADAEIVVVKKPFPLCPLICNNKCCEGPANSITSCINKVCGWSCKRNYISCGGRCILKPLHATGVACKNGVLVFKCRRGYTKCKNSCLALPKFAVAGRCLVPDGILAFDCLAPHLKCETLCCPLPPANGTSLCKVDRLTKKPICDFACAAGYTKCGQRCILNPTFATGIICKKPDLGLIDFECPNPYLKCGRACCPAPPRNGLLVCKLDGVTKKPYCDFVCKQGYTKCGKLCIKTPKFAISARCLEKEEVIDFRCRSSYVKCGNVCCSPTSPTVPKNAFPACIVEAATKQTRCGFVCKSGYVKCGKNTRCCAVVVPIKPVKVPIKINP